MSRDDPATNGRLLKPEEVAKILRMKPRSLERWRARGYGPPHVKISGRRVRYRSPDLDRWINSRLRASTAAEQPPREVAS